jgi:serine-type D-Ala-D-Ala carboxypeptidase
MEDAPALLDAAVAAGSIPGAALITGQGYAGWEPDAPISGHFVGRTATVGGSDVGPDTVFDLASLTKVVATLPSVLYLVDRGEVALDDPVIRFIPEFGGGTDRDAVTVRQLLSHTSGLPDGHPFYAIEGTPEERWQVVPTIGLIARPGSIMCYSDIGFMLLGRIVEAVTGMGLDEVATAVIFNPLGMADTRFCPPASWIDRCAATEPRPSGEVTIGAVHDENAAALGGIAGHAGLFATGADIARYIRSWCDPDTAVVSPEMRLEAFRCQTTTLAARRGLGWTLRGDRWDHMGTAWPATGAGHTGFTGTSIAIDPISGIWTVLLTNAVHLGRGSRAIIALRRDVHDAVARS